MVQVKVYGPYLRKFILRLKFITIVEVKDMTG